MYKEGVVDKICCLLKQVEMPDYLHKFGPKTYKVWQHVLVLFIKQECKLSYRRAVSLLRGLGFDVPTYSAVAKRMNKIPLAYWKAMLTTSAGTMQHWIGAMDSAFFSRTNPSYHYLKRMDSEMPVKKPVQLNLLIDTRSKKCVAIRVRAKRVHDARDRKYLLQHAPNNPDCLVADKAYDINDLHRYAKEHGFISIIPIRKNTHKGFYRNYMKQFYNNSIYHQRSLVETVISSIKRKTGSNILTKKCSAQRAELYARCITHNIKLIPKTKDFQQSLPPDFSPKKLPKNSLRKLHIRFF
jgi:hypothetical protein